MLHPLSSKTGDINNEYEVFMSFVGDKGMMDG